MFAFIHYAVKYNKYNQKIVREFWLKPYLRFVGKISVIKQSKAAFPHEITELNVAEISRF